MMQASKFFGGVLYKIAACTEVRQRYNLGLNIYRQRTTRDAAGFIVF